MYYRLSNEKTIELAKKYTDNFDDEMEFIYYLQRLSSNMLRFTINACEYTIWRNPNNKLSMNAGNTFTVDDYDLEAIYNSKEKFKKFILPKIIIVMLVLTFVPSFIWVFSHGNDKVNLKGWFIIILMVSSAMSLIVFWLYDLIRKY